MTTSNRLSAVSRCFSLLVTASLLLGVLVSAQDGEYGSPPTAPPTPPPTTPPTPPPTAPPTAPPTEPMTTPSTATPPANVPPMPNTPPAPGTTPAADTPAEDSGCSDDENDIKGRWYAVMTSGCSDGGPCNIFTNNITPCMYTSVYFLSLDDNGWQVYISSVNNETSLMTVDMGAMSSDSSTEFRGFMLSRATMSTSAVAASQFYITDKVSGCANFLKFKMTIIGYSVEAKYMITTITLESGSSITVIWCRSKTPGKAAVWTPIVQNLKELNINAHDLSFVKQEQGGVYSSMRQYNEMFFCA